MMMMIPMGSKYDYARDTAGTASYSITAMIFQFVVHCVICGDVAPHSQL